MRNAASRISPTSAGAGAGTAGSAFAHLTEVQQSCVYEADVTAAPCSRTARGACGRRALEARAGHARLDAQVLLAHVLGVSRAQLDSHPEAAADAARRPRYRRLLARRAAGEPLAYLTGRREFWSLDLAVTPAVLIPRPETELLVERALALASAGCGRAADLGTGSGAIAVALARERPGWRIVATDVSAPALAVARANAAALGAERIEFVAGSWFGPLGAARFDLLVSNPPYVGADDPALADPALALRAAARPHPGAMRSRPARPGARRRRAPDCRAAGCCSSTARARGRRCVPSLSPPASFRTLASRSGRTRADDGRTTMIRFETSHGGFTVELFPKEAPVTVENFLQYVDDGFFDGTIFHRIVPGFVIQGGGLTADFTSKKTRAPISNEAKDGLKNTRGSLSMARTSDINSATSQFFVNLKDNAFLDHGPRDYGYAVFGRVTEGMEVIDKIARVGTGTRKRLPGRAARGRRDRVRAAPDGVAQPRFGDSCGAALRSAAARAVPALSRQRGRLARAGCCRALAMALLAWLLLTAVPVLVLRWLHPLTSAFMLEARAQAALAHERGYRTDYRWVSSRAASPRTPPSRSSPPRISSSRSTPASTSTRSARRCAPASAASGCAAPARSRSRSRRTCSCGRGTASCARGSRPSSPC